MKNPLHSVLQHGEAELNTLLNWYASLYINRKNLVVRNVIYP